MSEFGDFLGAAVVGTVLAAFGQGINPCVPEEWGWWHRTLWLHPMIGGVLIYRFGSSLPVPSGMGDGVAGRILWGLFAGILAVPLYELVQRVLEKRAK